MKKLLSPTIIAALAIAPTFADNEPTLIPTPASCNNNVLNTTSGSASLEAIYTPNTITTQWYTGYGENTAVANATTCTYDGTINFPQTNPSRPGYAFNGWKLRTPTVQSNPLANLNTSIEPTALAGISFDESAALDGISFDESAAPYSERVASYGLTNPGTLAMTFSYGDIYVEASCNSTSVSGGDLVAALNNIWNQNLTGEEEELQSNQLFSNFNFVMRQSNTFTRGSNGDVCWCRVYGYKPTNGTMQSTSDAQWVMIMNCATTPMGRRCEADECEYEYVSCNDACVDMCAELSLAIPRARAYLYGQQ